MAAFTPNQIIGSYRIIELLGQGGMATVYKAQHTRLNRYVALKVMYPSFMNDPAFITRFEREAQIIARLDHPHIVPVHDYAEQDGMFYLVMKYIEGITLQHALGDGPLDLADIRRIMGAICDALDYAHSQGVLHRDIKPSNIMLDKKATPYLTDFGLARDSFDGESSISQGMMVGTPTYMSPEQAIGQRQLDARSDIYSLGIVLYQLLVGKAPFEGGSTYTILHKHQTEIPPMPSTLNPEIPPALEVVVLRAIAKDPDDRYESAGAMRAALEDALTSSQLRQFNKGERHSIELSLAQPRPKPAVGQGITLLTASRAEPGAPTRDRRGVRSAVPLPAEALRQKEGRSNTNTALAVILVAVLVVLIFGVIYTLRNSQTPQSNIGIADLPTQTEQPTEEATSLPPTTAPTAIPPTATVESLLNVTEETAPQQSNLVDPRSGAPPPPGSAPADEFSPLPAGVSPYYIAPANLDQAEALVTEEPDSAEAYLSLAQAQIVNRISLDIVRDTLQSAAARAEDQETFIVSLQSMLQHNALPPDVLFPLYDEVLRQSDGTLNAPMRERIGAHLYDMVERGVIQAFLLTRLNNGIADDADPLMFAIMAKLFIAHGNLRLAEASLNRAETDTPEIQLIRGELLAAQEETDEARRIWEALIDDDSVAQWIRRRAEQNLMATD